MIYWDSSALVAGLIGEDKSAQVFSFVRQAGIMSVDNQNIYDFFTILWEQLNILDGRKYIVGIEAGTEILDGSGSFSHFY